MSTLSRASYPDPTEWSYSDKMELHVQRLLNRVAIASITIATIILLLLILETPETCVPPDAPPKPHLRFPRSTCDSSPRQHLPLDKKNARLWSSKTWQNRLSSYTSFFLQIRQMGLLHNHSKALCISAGAGHEVMALSKMGLADVTGVELVDSPPLVSRADPHNLPFFDAAFDFAYSRHLAEALFPARFAREMERTVRRNGICVVAVDECGGEELRDIVALFKRSRFVGAANITAIGTKLTRIIMRVGSSY